MLGKIAFLLSFVLILTTLWPWQPLAPPLPLTASHLIAAIDYGQREVGIWHNLGPRGGMALALAISPDFANDRLVLSGEHRTWRHPTVEFGLGIRRSTDGGWNWHPTAVSPPYEAFSTTLALHDLAFSPVFATDSTAFAATWSGLFRSVDRGQSWQAVESGPNLFITSVAVAPDFAASRHVMAGYGYVSPLLYVSDDGGESWGTHPGVAASADIAYSPHFATDGTAFTAGASVNNNASVYRTTDYGLSWTPILTSTTFALAISPQFAADATIFAAGVDVVRVSNNAGAAWVAHAVTTNTTRIKALAISPAFATDDTLFAGGPQGLYQSTDRGEHWTAVAGYPGPDVHAIALDPAWPIVPTLLVGSTTGVCRSRDGGSTWAQGAGIAPLEVTRLVRGPEPQRLTAATHHGVRQSEDGGATWRYVGLSLWAGIANLELSPNYGRDQTMLAAAPVGAGLGFYRTTDGGTSWQFLNSADYPGGGLAFSPAFPADPSVFATKRGEIQRSTDLGKTWVPVGTPPTGTHSLGAWHVVLPPTYPADGTRFAGGAGFWRLPPGAEIWQLAATGLLTDTQVTSLAISPNYAVDRTLVATAQRTAPGEPTSSGVYRSTDQGVTWARLTTGLPPSQAPNPPLRIAISPDYADDRTLYVQTEVLLYRSSDGGEHWTAIAAPLEAIPLRDLVGEVQGRAYSGGRTGVWRYTTLPLRLHLPLVSR